MEEEKPAEPAEPSRGDQSPPETVTGRDGKPKKKSGDRQPSTRKSPIGFALLWNPARR